MRWESPRILRSVPTVGTLCNLTCHPGNIVTHDNRIRGGWYLFFVNLSACACISRGFPNEISIQEYLEDMYLHVPTICDNNVVVIDKDHQHHPNLQSTLNPREMQPYVHAVTLKGPYVRTYLFSHRLLD